MAQTKKRARPLGEEELKVQVPDLKTLPSEIELGDAHKLVVQQNRGLLLGEASMRQFTRRIAFNNFDLYFRVKALNSCNEVINSWLLALDIRPKSVKTKRVAKRFARSVWPDDGEGRRSSDEANVLEAAYRYFSKTMPGKCPSLEQFLAWVDDCDGLNNVRRGQIGVELGGKPSTRLPPPTAQELFATRKTLVRNTPSVGKLPYTPEGAQNGDLVILYGIVEEGETSIRLACRIHNDDAAKNVHNIKTSRFMRDGQPVLSHGMGEQVTMVSDNSAHTADEVIDHAAAQAK